MSSCDTCFPEQKQRLVDRDSIRGRALQLAIETGTPVAIYQTAEGQEITTFETAVKSAYPILQVILPQQPDA